MPKVSISSKCFALQVVLETLRLHPPATEIFRETKPGGMMLDEYYIPRATQVTVSHGCTNENKNNYITVHMHARINLSIFGNKAKITRHKVSAIFQNIASVLQMDVEYFNQWSVSNSSLCRLILTRKFYE